MSQAQLDRGYRLTELLKQGLNSPLLVEEQVVSIWAGTRGHLDGVDVSDVGRFEAELLDLGSELVTPTYWPTSAVRPDRRRGNL
ncbi:MAG: hypothetical protein CM1200mP26_06220 [Acidimicrobiales bacterium]|nr:MAG: hypothetical protein CM1200mP26_06220 [Acidimicrobiales bacterium]